MLAAQKTMMVPIIQVSLLAASATAAVESDKMAYATAKMFQVKPKLEKFDGSIFWWQHPRTSGAYYRGPSSLDNLSSFMVHTIDAPYQGHNSHYKFFGADCLVFQKDVSVIGEIHAQCKIKPYDDETEALLRDNPELKEEFGNAVRIIDYFKREVTHTGDEEEVSFQEYHPSVIDFSRPQPDKFFKCKEISGEDYVEVISDDYKYTGVYLHKKDMIFPEKAFEKETPTKSAEHPAGSETGSVDRNTGSVSSEKDGHRSNKVEQKPQNHEAKAPSYRYRRASTVIDFEKRLADLIAAENKAMARILNSVKSPERRRLILQPSRLITLANKNK